MQKLEAEQESKAELHDRLTELERRNIELQTWLENAQEQLQAASNLNVDPNQSLAVVSLSCKQQL